MPRTSKAVPQRMHQQALCGCQVSSTVTFRLNSRLSAGPKTRKPRPRPWCADPNRDTGAENSTSNQRFLVRTRHKQTSPQSKATQPFGGPRFDTCPKSPHALRRCAEPLGTWKRTKQSPSPARKSQKSSRWRPTAILEELAFAGYGQQYFDRTMNSSGSAQGKSRCAD